MKKLKDTHIPENWSAALYNEKGMDIAGEHMDKICYVTFYAVSNALADTKTQNNPTAFMFKEPNGDFIAAAVVMYVPNEDPKKPGSWNYYWTWYAEDVPENAAQLVASDAQLSSYFRGVGQTKYGMGFTDVESIYETTKYVLKTIRKWLDENAVDKEERGVELDGVFEARVAVEECGEKVMSIEPAGEIKKLIKDDSAIEV